MLIGGKYVIMAGPANGDNLAVENKIAISISFAGLFEIIV